MTKNLLREVDDAIRTAAEAAIAGGAHRRYVGEYSARLAEQVASLVGGGHALLCCSASAALEIALRGLGVGQGQRVLMAAYDYPGNSWAVERVGARPVLVDVQRDGWNLDTGSLLAAMERCSDAKVLIASHLHGQTQDTDALHAICQKNRLVLIEDCCQAIGARRPSSRLVGSMGDLATLSFGGGKQLTAGRGGALIVRDEALFQRCKIVAGAGSGPYALGEFQAAILLAQLPWLDRIADQCREFFQLLASVWQEPYKAKVRLQMPFVREYAPTFYQAGLLIQAIEGEAGIERLTEWRSATVASLLAAGIPAGSGFDGLHRRSNRRCDKPVDLARAAQAAAGTVVVHHSVACTGEVAPEQLAELLSDALGTILC